MPPDVLPDPAPPAADPAPVAAAPPRPVSSVAPPRAARLVARPVRPVRPAPSAAAAVPSTPLPGLDPFAAARRYQPSPVERKLAGLHDARQLLQTLDTELQLQRVRRLHGGGPNQGIRVLAVVMLFALLIAGLGAMFYLQSKLAQSGFHRRPAAPAAVTAPASPAPAPSAPAAGPAPAAGRPAR